MGLFDAIFGKNREPIIQGYYDTLTAYQPVFTNHSGGLYEMDKTRSAIHAIATHCSKLKPNVTGSRAKQFEKMLQYKPNQWQTTSQFLYRLATILEVENTAFIVPILNEYGKTVGLFPVLPHRVEIVKSTNGTMYLRYSFANGDFGSIEYSKCGVMTKMQYKNDFFGSDNKALVPTMNVITTQNQGIEEGIKSAAAIRFMAKLGTVIRPEDLKKEQENFRKMNLSADNNGGVLMFDQKYADVKQVNSQPYIVDAEQMKLIDNNVFDYFGVNEKILRNEWDEQSWNAFYEGKIEPFAIQLSLVLTSMLLTENEVSFGNEITVSANRLQFASVSTKVSLITQLFDRGMLSANEGREIMQMPRIEGGDVYMVRGEYVNKDDKIGSDDNE